ncbi:MAG: hypothetical protein JXA53_06875 [Bacteroidales bacterium]|nr:hypothetical protein [Bacteroidales bacterium]
MISQSFQLLKVVFGKATNFCMNKAIRYFVLAVSLFVLSNSLYAIKFVPSFTPPNAAPASATVKSADDLVEYVDSLEGVLRQTNNYIENLLPDQTYTLPLGLVKNIGGVAYMIVLDDMEISPTGMVLQAYMKLDIPGSGKSIGLMAKDVKVTYAGISSARLRMLEDVELPFGNSKAMAIYADKTFVDFDCNGYKSTSLSASVLFSRKMLIPIDETGKEIGGQKRVKGVFTADFVDANDLLVSVTIDPFAVVGLKDFGFKISTASIDFSDNRNPIGMVFPNDYTSGGMITPGDELWRGIYIGEFKVILPKKLGNRSDGQQVTVSAKNLIIDDSGVSGSFVAENIITLDKGNLGGWRFSIDKIEANIVKNNFQKFGFQGKVELPTAKDKESVLSYKAFIDADSQYMFTVGINSNMSFDVFASKLTLEKNSYIEVKDIDDKFVVKAVLNGSMNISTTKKSKDAEKESTKLDIGQVKFQELTIQSISPNLSVKYFGVSTGLMAGFPINIKEVGFKTFANNKFGIYFDIMINFVGESDGSFSGETAFTLVGKVDKTIDGSSDYKFDGIQLNKILVDIKQEAFSIKGGINFYREDDVYGSGFKGMVDVRFSPGISLAAVVQFGSVNNFRYWFADAMITFPTAVPVCPTFGFYGFGGGAYYHMKQEVLKPIEYTAGLAENSVDNSLEPGVSLSGTKYVPDKSVSLGIKASVVIGTLPSPKVFHGSAMFKIEFLEAGGIGYIGFEGEAFIMTDMGATKENASLYAGLKIDMDFVNKTFFSRLDVHLNVAGVVKGAHEGNRAGTAIMYFAPKEWYIYMGKPDDRIAILILNAIRLDSYMCMGTSIPDMPPPPAKVSEILGGMDLDMMRDENALADGAGFAFGASLSVHTGEKTFLIFYGSFDLGVGFDIMLKDYGKGVRCKGQEDPLGMNGWYASGQMYAYVQGEIGIKVKLFGRKKKYEILSMGMAAVLQAKLPNPSYMRGVVGGYYRILGGLIKGRCKFELEIGHQCEIVGGTALSGINVISDISPAHGTRDVNVFASPQATFNIELNKSFEMVDVDDKKKAFRAVLDNFDITCKGEKLAGQKTWNDDNTVLAFETEDVMPGKSQVEVKVKIHFDEMVNGTWKKVIIDGKEQGEEKTFAFTTGENPDNIPKNNVKYSYPIDRMVNLYKKEYSQGYITLKKGQPGLFEPSNDYKNELRFVSKQGTIKGNFNYNKAEKTIYFDIPTQLNNNTIYSFNLVKVPSKVVTDITKNVNNNEAVTETGDTLTTKNIEGTVELTDEKMVYDLAFRTSYYDTFSEKIDKTISNKYYSDIISTGIHSMAVRFQGKEMFDKFELGDDAGNILPLIRVEGDLYDNYWYKKYMHDLLYKYYPVHKDAIITNRDVTVFGLPPFRDVDVVQWDRDLVLTESNITSGQINTEIYLTSIRSNISNRIYQDYMDLVGKAYYLKSFGIVTDMTTKLMNSSFESERAGKYKFVAKYILPGKEIKTSEKKIIIKY